MKFEPFALADKNIKSHNSSYHFQFPDRPDQDAAGKAEQEADRERLRDPHRGAGDVQVRLGHADQVPGRLQPILHPHPARLWHEVTSASRQPGLYQVSPEILGWTSLLC